MIFGEEGRGEDGGEGFNPAKKMLRLKNKYPNLGGPPIFVEFRLEVLSMHGAKEFWYGVMGGKRKGGSRGRGRGRYGIETISIACIYDTCT